MKTQRGFTLVEVLLALAVLSLAMIALGQTLGASAVAYRNIDDTRLAYMVAADKLVEMQTFQLWPENGEQDDRVKYGEREWWVQTKISDGPYPDTRRVDIDVGPLIDDEEMGLAYSLASLIGKPAAAMGENGNGPNNNPNNPGG